MDRPPSRKHAKAPESVAAQRFPALIVSSHAGGHWFESSSLHQKVPDFVRNQELFLFMSSNSDAAFWRFSLDPNRDPKAERSGKHRRGADGIIRPSPAVFCGLHGLADDAADGLQDLLMGVPEGIRVEHGAGLGRYEQVGTVWVLCVFLHQQEYRYSDRHPKTKL